MPTPEEELADLVRQRSALREAMRSGVLTITHGDKTVKHRSMADMQAALSDINSEIGVLTGTGRRRIRYTSVRKGL